MSVPPAESRVARPFSVVVPSAANPLVRPEEADDADDAEWSMDQLEAEYQRAVEAAEQAELLSELTFDALGAPPPPAPDEPKQHEPSTADETPLASTREAPGGPRVNVADVLEALVFVGGAPLTARRLAEVAGVAEEQVNEQLSALSRRYREQGRPYDVRLTDGGYEIALLPEFESVRNRVYGHGPREVRLTPNILEILAFVAYQQPVSKTQLAETAQPDVDSHVRQLIRRDLVAITRDAEGQVTYGTTPRFLELFGLRSIADLPRSEDFRFK